MGKQSTLTKASRARRDTKERLELWYTYGSERSCYGGHLVHANYCCLHCGSSDPDNECLKEKVKRP
jgi:hypothetical protein